APNVLAQQALLESALAQAKLSPEDISYIETHGTGTPLGDPIEFEALKAVIGKPRKDDSPCVLGAAKTNLGHLEGAAGIAGLIKVVLAMRHGKIPRNLHFKKLNPRISLTGTPFVIPTEEVPWPAGKEPRRAGVSSFGASGTNAHVILEEAPTQPEVAPERVMRHHLLPLSARSPEALRDLAGVWRDFFQRDPESTGTRLHDICYTASRRRMHHEYRLSVVADSSRAFAERLGMFLDGDPPAGLTQGRKRPSRTYETVFVFPGYGSQWVGMGRTLLETEPVFREAIEACDAAIRQEESWSLLSVLTAPEADSRLGEIEILQPALLAVEIALARLWMSWGVRPDAVVGHSMGEIAAAHLAGALSLEDAMRLVCRRSRLLARMTGTGASAVIGLSYEEAAAALEPYEGRITIAVNNSPRSTLISGEAKAVEALVDALEARGVFCRRMTPKIAAHSPQMEPYLPELTEALAGISPQESQITFFSTALGRSLAGSDLTADYWARNLREPVLFYHAVRKLVEGGHTVFIEMSPHPL
ncbi:MAG: polyketide synthase, partial [Deltaproteobacteria bacterium]